MIASCEGLAFLQRGIFEFVRQWVNKSAEDVKCDSCRKESKMEYPESFAAAYPSQCNSFDVDLQLVP